VSAGHASLPDALLDRTVIGSYTSLGYALRSPHWAESELESMSGKVALVTGATSGLGEAAAAGFARLGATVWLLARDRERADQAKARIFERTGNDSLMVGICDLSELCSVRRFAERLVAQSPRLDVLVNNAGVLTEERSLSRDGIELTLATNVVGPFLLTKLLSPLLRASAPARVVNVSSGGMYTQRLRLDDLQSTNRKFRGAAAYARCKRMQVILSELWASRLGGDRRGRQRDAPGLGRHARAARLAPRLLPAAAEVAANSRAGRRHDRVARLGAAGRGRLRRVLAGPGSSPDTPVAVHRRIRGRAPAFVG
jgi:dehydrogenase/reductase SDR family protein 12